MKPSEMPPYIFDRLILAKKLYQKGIEECRTEVDIYSFCSGIALLHNALDNFTSAIACKIGIEVGEKDTFPKIFKEINKYERDKGSGSPLLNEQQLYHFNSIRNSIKHKGIMPNVPKTKPLVASVTEFFEICCEKYFDLDWTSLSLVDLIKKEEIRKEMIEIEKMITKKEYKEALNKMAIIKFKVFDEGHLRIGIDPTFFKQYNPVNPEKWNHESNIFLVDVKEFIAYKNNYLYEATDFLEKGIDKRLMNHFESFTPTVGIDNTKDWGYILKHGPLWAKENWTHDICTHFFYFLIDAIIKSQGLEHKVKSVEIDTRYTIKILEDFSIYATNSAQGVVYNFKKNEEKEVIVPARIDGSWEIFKPRDCTIFFADKDSGKYIWGFFNEGDQKKIEFISGKKIITLDDGSQKEIQLESF